MSATSDHTAGTRLPARLDGRGKLASLAGRHDGCLSSQVNVVRPRLRLRALHADMLLADSDTARTEEGPGAVGSHEHGQPASSRVGSTLTNICGRITRTQPDRIQRDYIDVDQLAQVLAQPLRQQLSPPRLVVDVPDQRTLDRGPSPGGVRVVPGSRQGLVDRPAVLTATRVSRSSSSGACRETASRTCIFSTSFRIVGANPTVDTVIVEKRRGQQMSDQQSDISPI
jgi:hypothetical protein